MSLGSVVRENWTVAYYLPLAVATGTPGITGQQLTAAPPAGLQALWLAGRRRSRRPPGATGASRLLCFMRRPGSVLGGLGVFAVLVALERLLLSTTSSNHHGSHGDSGLGSQSRARAAGETGPKDPPSR